jgi:hypothetical protein
MTETYFFRLLKEHDKDAALLQAVTALRAGRESRLLHRVAQCTFAMIPGAPLAYWVFDSTPSGACDGEDGYGGENPCCWWSCPGEAEG